MNNAVVIGRGVVGKATMAGLGIEDFIDLKGQTISWEEAKKKKYVFICLPTNLNEDGWYDFQDMDKVLDKVSSSNNITIIRSTVYPGYCRSRSTMTGNPIASNPEFLSEATWEEDARHPRMVVIGADDAKVREDVLAVYAGRYTYIKPVLTNTITAEMIKLTFNSWFAVKVLFFNEIYDAAQAKGANYETIKTAIESHPWGAKNHTTVNFNGRRGLHGRCLPKDLEAFANFTGSPLLKTVHELNRRFI